MMATYNRTSLRVVEARAAGGDTIADSTLIAATPNTPICAGVKKLTFTQCRFVRCVPPDGAICDDRCTFDQRPVPPEPEPEEIFTVGRSELAAIVEAARDGRRTDVTAFCVNHGLTLTAEERT